VTQGECAFLGENLHFALVALVLDILERQMTSKCFDFLASGVEPVFCLFLRASR
jgi:hypothetical protein